MTPKSPMLISRKVWNLPIPEVIYTSFGAFFLIAYPELNHLNIRGGGMVGAGWIAFFFGTPLIIARINIFWFDLVYLLAGFTTLAYIKYFTMGPNFGMGAVIFLAEGILLAGTSYLIRRILAYLFYRKTFSEKKK